jgi:hypothetical protein
VRFIVTGGKCNGVTQAPALLVGVRGLKRDRFFRGMKSIQPPRNRVHNIPIETGLYWCRLFKNDRWSIAEITVDDDGEFMATILPTSHNVQLVFKLIGALQWGPRVEAPNF